MDADTVALLEEKVLQTIETVNKLRKERDAALSASGDTDQLRSQVKAIEQRNLDLVKELEQARAERDALRSDKDTVRLRLEKLLKHIDSLGG